MRVYYPGPPDAEVLQELRAAVPSDVDISSEARPDGYEVLVEGRPVPEMLETPGLRALIVPFAGVPLTTLELLRSKPHIAGYNLHHNAGDTAEMAIALLFAAAKDLVPMDQALRENDWSGRYGESRTVSLDGKTAVVLGFGEIGKRVAKILIATGMKVVAVRRSPGGHEEGPLSIVDVSELSGALARADVLIIALPHTPPTTGLVGSEELTTMPRGGILVNVARGPVVDERALFEALKTGHLHSAGLDVWYRYPESQANAVPGYFSISEAAHNTPPSEYPFGDLPNVVLSPHRAGVSMDTERHRVAHLASILRALAEGRQPPNRIDPDAGY